MRWPQFLLTLFNLAFAVYVIVTVVFFTTDLVQPLTFLWALVYLTLSLAMSHLYMLYMSNKIDDWYDVDSMDSIANLSIVSTFFCTLALATSIGLEYYHKKQFLATDYESLRQAVPLIAALICSVALFSSSIKFKKYIILCRSVNLPTRIQMPRNYHTNDN